MAFSLNAFLSTGLRKKLAYMALIGPMALASTSFAQTAAPSALSETFGNWQVNCQSVSNPGPNSGPNPGVGTKRVCQMSQQQVDSKSGRTVILFALDKPDAKTKVTPVTVIVPFGVDLSAGISLLVDDAALTDGQYLTCLPQGCVARISLDPAMMATLAKGKEMQITMKPVGDGEAARTVLSLDGFNNASTRLTTLDK